MKKHTVADFRSQKSVQCSFRDASANKFQWATQKFPAKLKADSLKNAQDDIPFS